MLALSAARVAGGLLGSGSARSLRCLHGAGFYVSCFTAFGGCRRCVASQPGLAFGELYRPSTAQERALQSQIAERVPFDMVEDWQERNDRVFRDRLVHMPEQFAEASQRYSSDPRDYLLSSLLRHCVTRRSRTR